MQRGRSVGTAPARAGLAGNPSDGFGGAVLGVPVGLFGATVTVSDAAAITVRGPRAATSWATVGALADDVDLYGHDGGDRLVTAAIVRLAAWAQTHGSAAGAVDDAFEVRWRTTVPRSVGLAGSSAIVVATMRALVQRWGLDVDRRVLAALALDAERALGITAGMQDRLVQSFALPVLMDFADGAWSTVAGVAVPTVRRVAPPSPIPLYLAWRREAAAPSQGYHRGLAERHAEGEQAVLSTMRTLATLASEAAAAAAAGDVSSLARLIDRSFDARHAVAPQGSAHVAMIEAARAAGFSAGSAGSGGAIVGVMHGRSSFTRLQAALEPLGCGVRRFRLG